MTNYSKFLEKATGVSSITFVIVRPWRALSAVSAVLIDSLLAQRLRLAIRFGKLGGCACSTIFSMRIKKVYLYTVTINARLPYSVAECCMKAQGRQKCDYKRQESWSTPSIVGVIGYLGRLICLMLQRVVLSTVAVSRGSGSRWCSAQESRSPLV